MKRDLFKEIIKKLKVLKSFALTKLCVCFLKINILVALNVKVVC